MTFDAKGQRHLVIGAGATGAAVARFLAGEGGKVCVADRAEAALEKADLPPGVERRADDGRIDLASFDVVVPSPGVPRDHPLLRGAQQRAIPILGEIELAFRNLRCPVVAITGTNGKSTTTVVLGEMFRHAGIDAFVGGNLGTPLIDACLPGAAPAVAVAEVSSFQLEWVATFRPRIAVLLNLTPDHLDRYADMEDYGKAKANLLRMQEPGDFAVLNRDDVWVWEQRQATRATVISFGREPVEFGSFLDGDEMVVRGPDARPQRYDLRAAPLQGAHNRENLLAAATAATVWGLPAAAIAAAIRETRSLPHRLECVRVVAGVAYYDDSKGTNVGAVAKSLASFPGGVILLAGGYDKGADFGSIAALLRERVSRVIAFGAAAATIASQVGPLVPTTVAGGLADAVREAAAVARAGEVVVLSPGCASFDEFSDYRDRGRRFRQWVEAL
jgi:UDP-N-acetylmuramoylalanine--D-glutamate ligase